MVIVLLLWVLWMTAAILVIEQRQDFYPLDNCQFLAPNQLHWCNELFAIQGLTITIFVLLIKYLLILLIFSFVNHSRGVYVWTSSVKDLQLTLPKIQMTHSSDVDAMGNPIKKEASLFGAPATYPPAPQNTYPPPSTTAPYNQPQYSGSSAQLTPQRTGEPNQLNQSVSYSRPQPNTGRPVVAPAQQSMYAHYNPPSTTTVPSAPQV
ncbi:hypothetical protein JR316_0007441 [Psilocybe cubensis]|uniref:Uncharacterized protein n=2 Tax=Psilocybe cubensis TaxID=181762 RepID=A0A8H8CHJ8_PSICU|nr:hypothetical protein JR316_0007441 [Psilocybe cubensis]KAH9480839.1 hypothetical protein JR316_0007441 [Psilocybe cubensis]